MKCGLTGLSRANMEVHQRDVVLLSRRIETWSSVLCRDVSVAEGHVFGGPRLVFWHPRYVGRLGVVSQVVRHSGVVCRV